MTMENLIVRENISLKLQRNIFPIREDVTITCKYAQKYTENTVKISKYTKTIDRDEQGDILMTLKKVSKKYEETF